MTKFLDQAFGVVPTSDLKNIPEPIENEIKNQLIETKKQLSELDGSDHYDAMDEIHKEALKNAKDILELGMNIDHARASSVFEQAVSFMRLAMDAKNSKRDTQIELLKLSLAKEKQEFIEEKERNKQTNDNTKTIDAKNVIIEDRNEILRLIKEQLDQKD